jgi:DNA oxidative demethylase
MGSLPLFEQDVLPEGLVFRREFLSIVEHDALLEHVARTAFVAVKMRGVVARRRVAHFGWGYGFDSRTHPVALPDFLLPLRVRVAREAGRNAEEFAEALVTEYQPGAAIGWHRDAAPFGVVAGISLGSACRLRFRRAEPGRRWLRAEVEAAPRSLYLLDGPARAGWQHSIPPVEHLRYSITFRTLRRPGLGGQRTAL